MNSEDSKLCVTSNKNNLINGLSTETSHQEILHVNNDMDQEKMLDA